MTLQGSPSQGLIGATLGFFVGFAAVALFGPIAHQLQADLNLSPVMLGFVVAAPMLSGSLFRIPFSAWVDTSGGRKPFLTLLCVSILGNCGLLLLFGPAAHGRLSHDSYPWLLVCGALCGCGIATFSVGAGQVAYWFPCTEQGRALGIYAGFGNLAPGIFSWSLPIALSTWGAAVAYRAWLLFVVAGTALYALIGRDAWYFRLRRRGIPEREALRMAHSRGQQIFPTDDFIGSLCRSALRPCTWALVALYFVTFGGFLALTAWLPTFWVSAYGVTSATAGFLAAVFAFAGCLLRVAGGALADRLGGERTSVLSLWLLLIGALAMAFSAGFALSITAELLIAAGMGVNNAAVFKLVPGYLPDAVGGASGWVGGLGAFGGFLIPPALGFFVELLGPAGYACGFLIFAALAVLGLSVARRLVVAPDGLDRALSSEEPAQHLARS